MPRTRQDREELEVPAGDELLTVYEVAKLLRCDTTTVRRWIKLGALEAVILPHVNKRCAYRVKQGIVDDMLTPHTLERSRG